MFRNYLYVFLFISLLASAQGRGNQKKEIPVLHEVSNKDVVQSVYPDAVKVEKVNDFWFRILNEKNKVIGFAMASTPYCKDVIGYNNTTPVMIITDKSWKIQKVSILTHWETLGYVRKLEKNGYFNLWVGKSLKDAKTVRPDGYTGATCTALAVSKNVDFLLNNGIKKLPRN